jgi:hypothetical protein
MKNGVALLVIVIAVGNIMTALQGRVARSRDCREDKPGGRRGTSTIAGSKANVP